LPDLEHPSITHVNRTGYANVVNQPEHFGTDVMGREIVKGNSYIEMPNGELLHEDSVEDYHIEVLGLTYKTAD
jgi:hypothetical protein